MKAKSKSKIVTGFN